MIAALNHITLAVRNVEISFDFYRNVLGFTPTLKWATGAYFDVGGTWFCISQDSSRDPTPDYTHLAFSVEPEDFESVCRRLQSSGVRAWKENKSEGKSFYFQDPDGHKLELHVGDMTSRLKYYKKNPPEGARFF